MTDINAEQKFLSDVATHQMTVLRDDGLYRHVRFKRPDTICMHFDLITLPGKLIYTGDMGTYVFERLTDMFEFFRTEGEKLKINKGYWAEKLIASDCNGRHADGAKEFSAETFKRNVLRWIRESRAEGRAAVLRAVREEVFPIAEEDDTGVRAMDALNDFEHDGFRFNDCWEMDCTEWTTRFVWCCYALAWGIKQYDAAKAAQQQETVHG